MRSLYYVVVDSHQDLGVSEYLKGVILINSALLKSLLALVFILRLFKSDTESTQGERFKIVTTEPYETYSVLAAGKQTILVAYSIILSGHCICGPIYRYSGFKLDQ